MLFKGKTVAELWDAATVRPTTKNTAASATKLSTAVSVHTHALHGLPLKQHDVELDLWCCVTDLRGAMPEMQQLQDR